MTDNRPPKARIPYDAIATLFIDYAHAYAAEVQRTADRWWDEHNKVVAVNKELRARIEVLEELETLTMVELREEVDRQAGRIVGLLETIQDLKQFHPHYQE